jgi:hypothetical protein
MSDPKTVSPYFCLPLLEDALPDSGTATPDSFQLPASFPAEILDEEQLEAVAAWFDTWVADLLHSMRLALLGKPGTPADLAHLHQHATVLAHLLRLHPAAESTITELATTLGVSRRTLFYVRDSVLAHIRPALAGTIARKCAVANFYAQLATIGTLDAATITQLLTKGKTELIKDFTSHKSGKKFDAYLVLNASTGRVSYEFPPRK